MSMRAKSPTISESLLWASKLKREGAHLLKIHKALEARFEQLIDRVKNAEANAQTAETRVNSITDFEIRLKALEQDEDDQEARFVELDHDRREKLGKMEQSQAALNRRLEALKTELRAGFEERDQAATKPVRDDAVYERVDLLEAAVTEVNSIQRSLAAELRSQQADILEITRLHQRVHALDESMETLKADVANVYRAQPPQKLAGKTESTSGQPSPAREVSRISQRQTSNTGKRRPRPRRASPSGLPKPLYSPQQDRLSSKQAREIEHRHRQIPSRAAPQACEDQKPKELGGRVTRSGLPFTQQYDPDFRKAHELPVKERLTQHSRLQTSKKRTGVDDENDEDEERSNQATPSKRVAGRTLISSSAKESVKISAPATATKKPFHCPFPGCLKGYGRKDHVNRHMLNVHGNIASSEEKLQAPGIKGSKSVGAPLEHTDLTTPASSTRVPIKQALAISDLAVETPISAEAKPLVACSPSKGAGKSVNDTDQTVRQTAAPLQHHRKPREIQLPPLGPRPPMW